ADFTHDCRRSGVGTARPFIFNHRRAAVVAGRLRGPNPLFLANAWLIALALVLVLAWLHRGAQKISELCATIGAAYVIILAFSDGFSFQYFTWSLPFWFFCRAGSSFPRYFSPAPTFISCTPF